MKLSNSSSVRRTGVYRNFYRLRPLQLVCLLSLVAGCLISACDQHRTNLAFATKAKKGKKVELAASESITSPRIPLIDAGAPTSTETATFALG